MEFNFLRGMATLLAALQLATLEAAKVTINITKAASGDAVRVSWSGIDLSTAVPMKVAWSQDEGAHSHLWAVEPSGAQSLWIGQFSPPIQNPDAVRMGSDPKSHGVATEGTPPFTEPAPAKFISGTQLSAGSYDFVVTNMRADINWVLFSGSLDSAAGFKVLAVSPVLSMSETSQPHHVRLARTSSVDEMRVSWTSVQGDGTHQVQWGTAPDSLSTTTLAASHTYTQVDLCGFPANASGWHAPGWFREAVLALPRDRTAADRFYYRVGSEGYGWSSTRSFAAPQPAGPHGALSVLVTADMGETYEDGSQYHWEEPSAVNTTSHMARWLASHGGSGLDLVLHPGDLSYATGYESEWDRFMEQIEPLTSAVPYMTGMGNHERDFPGSGNSIGAGDSGGECGVPTQARFHMPTCPPPNTKPCVGLVAAAHSADFSADFSAVHLASGHAARRLSGPVGSADDGWYSFEQGPVHFLMLHTEMSSRVGSRQHSFVAADLAAVDRSLTPWVLVFGHRQMYSGNTMRPANDMGDLEPLLVGAKVDVAFWGHIHFAQRSCPMVNATCVHEVDAAGYDAPIHAVIGNAGQTLTNFPASRAPWSVYQGYEWGFSHVTVHNATHLTLDFFGDAPLNVNAPLHHSVTIERAFPRI